MRYHGNVGPPRTLTERLEQLNDNLQSLGSRLKESIASAIGSSVAGAVQDAIRGLLGVQPEHLVNREPDWLDERERSWREPHWSDPDEERWQEPYERDYDSPPSHQNQASTTRLRNAVTSALQASLFWLREQKSRRPMLTTGVVAVAAGVTAYFYGPALAAGVGMLTSVAGLLLTADGTHSALESLAGLASR